MRLFIIKQNVVSSAICFELSFENRMRNKVGFAQNLSALKTK